jgi:hypothetical protein
LPNLPALPIDEAGWRALVPRFAIDSGTFHTKIEQSRASISGTSDHGDADDVENEVTKQAVLLGTEAWRLSQRMRAHYGLPPPDLGWDVAESLRGQKRALDRRQAAAAETDQIFWEAFSQEPRDDTTT